MSSKKKKVTGARATAAALRTTARAQSSSADGDSNVNKGGVSAALAAAPSPAAQSSSHGGVAGAHRSPFGSRLVLVTVGTTRFDALIAAINAEAAELIDWMQMAGFGRIMLQIGAGAVEPLQLQEEAQRRAASATAAASSVTGKAATVPTVSWFRFSPDMLLHVAASDLVVSHAGAGSILEALRLHRPLLVVVNDALMHNHQMEVADALQQGRFLYQCQPRSLMHTLRTANWSPPIEPAITLQRADSHDASGGDQSYQLLRYPPVQSDAFPQLLEQHVEQVLRPASPTAALVPALFTTVLPALLAFAITWILFQ
jgi:beta-1,4-N-acetylglucosaminyltransferase